MLCWIDIGNEGYGNEESDYVMEKSAFESSYELISGQLLECRDWDSNSSDQYNIEGNFHCNYG